MSIDEEMRTLERGASFGDVEATSKLRSFYVRFGASLPVQFLERGASLGMFEAAVLLHNHYVRFGVPMPVTRTFQFMRPAGRKELAEVARRLGWLPDPDVVVPERRSRVRRVSEHTLAERARERALVTRRFAFFAEHGGSVPNSYGYPAWTEGAVAVARPDGRVAVGVNFLPANKVTLKGAAFAVTGREAAAAPGLRDERVRREAAVASDLWDARVKSPARKRAARAALVRWADFPREWNPLTPAKARLMLHEGRARGHPLTERQRRYFGALASGVARNSGGDEMLRDLERRAFEGDQRRGVGIPHQSIRFDVVGPIEVAERWLLLRSVGRNPPVPPAPRPEEIRVVCMVCGVHVRGDPRAPHVSHGYCEPCGRAELEKWRPRRQTKRRNPDEDLRALERSAEGGDVDALERLLVESMRRDDRDLSFRVDRISFFLQGILRDEHGMCVEHEGERLHEIGLRSWEHRNRVVRHQGGRFPLPFAGNPDEQQP